MRTPRALEAARSPITRPLLTLLVTALILVWTAPAGASTGQTGGFAAAAQLTVEGNAPVVEGTLEQCMTTGEQGDRSATFFGEMTAVSGTARMAMKIEVQERTPDEELFRTVSAPGLGVWRDSQPGVKIYKYVRQVTNLSGPAVYRALVHFHWLNDKGEVMRRAERYTSTCMQPAPAVTPAPTTPPTSPTPPTSGAGASMSSTG